MPKKPKYGKALQSKKKKVRRAPVSTAAAASASAPKDTPVVATPLSGGAARTKAPAVKYPYVTAELRRIGILAGTILVILIVLALVL
ncbi:MAG TPA: hypothetical protein G4O20_04625 [Dehalococcoidia bacterium]|nr:hypothetical protein [Dehalococcoidia bacterium]